MHKNEKRISRLWLCFPFFIAYEGKCEIITINAVSGARVIDIRMDMLTRYLSFVDIFRVKFNVRSKSKTPKSYDSNAMHTPS